MRLNIVVDIDIDESGLIEDEVKDDIVSFTRDLLINGACEQQIGLTLREVDYLVDETEVTHGDDSASVSKPLTGPQSITSEVFNTIMREMPEGASVSDVNKIFECIKDEMHEVKMKIL